MGGGNPPLFHAFLESYCSLENPLKKGSPAPGAGRHFLVRLFFAHQQVLRGLEHEVVLLLDHNPTMPSRGRWPALAALLQTVGSFALSTAPLHTGFYTRGPPMHLRRQPCTACVPDELERDAGRSSAPLATPAPPGEWPAGLPAQQATPQQATLKAVVALNVVTLLWGSQHAVIKGLVDLTESPALVNAVRFDLAALLALPWLPRPRPDDPEADRAARATWASGVDLSCISSSYIYRVPRTRLHIGFGRRGQEERESRSDHGSYSLSGVDLGLWTFAGFSLQVVGLHLASARYIAVTSPLHAP